MALFQRIARHPIISRYFSKGLLILSITAIVYAIYGITSYSMDDLRNRAALTDLRKHYYAAADSSSPNSSPLTYYEFDELHLHPEGAVFNDSKNKPTVTATVNNQPVHAVQERFQELLQINEEIVGWLTIDQTLIDYPVVQSNDNEFYLDHDVTRKPNNNGSIFMDYRNDINNFPQQHIVLYGHNMKNKSMFASLLHYESSWYLQQHPIIQFDTLYEKGHWEIFSVQKTNTQNNYIRTNFANEEDFLNFIHELKESSLHEIDVELNPQDIILTLSTCSTVSDDSRFAVHARLIRDDSL